MKYRRLDSNGDYVFGQGDSNFIQNTPATVGQAVKTRLQLQQGEWFLDTSIGTPYNSSVMGTGTISLYDSVIQSVILETPGVTGISAYASGVDPYSRNASITCTIDTIYGQTTLQTTL
jgi:hypothetical protein